MIPAKKVFWFVIIAFILSFVYLIYPPASFVGWIVLAGTIGDFNGFYMRYVEKHCQANLKYFQKIKKYD